MGIEDRIDRIAEDRRIRLEEFKCYIRDHPSKFFLRTILEPFYTIRNVVNIPEENLYRKKIFKEAAFFETIKFAGYSALLAYLLN